MTKQIIKKEIYSEKKIFDGSEGQKIEEKIYEKIYYKNGETRSNFGKVSFSEIDYNLADAWVRNYIEKNPEVNYLTALKTYKYLLKCITINPKIIEKEVENEV